MRAKDLGPAGEDVAVDFLRLKGYHILARNYRSSRREIDVVARSADTLVFVEVKSRTTSDHGLPQESVVPKKQLQIAKAALDYVRRSNGSPAQIRFDVVAVAMSADGSVLTVEHIPNAFPAPRQYFL
jgi:putative endonuclease